MAACGRQQADTTRSQHRCPRAIQSHQHTLRAGRSLDNNADTLAHLLANSIPRAGCSCTLPLLDHLCRRPCIHNSYSSLHERQIVDAEPFTQQNTLTSKRLWESQAHLDDT